MSSTRPPRPVARTLQAHADLPWRRLTGLGIAAALVWAAPRAHADAEASAAVQPGWGSPDRNLPFRAGIPVLAIPVGSAVGLGGPVDARTETGTNDYRITRGDELSLRFYYTPELNTTAVVRSDGRISVPLLGEVRVEGLTISEMAVLIEGQLAPQVKRAQVAINLQGAGNQRVFVGGEVTKPGMQALVGPLTVLQAVMVAEGMKDIAQPSQVLLLRRGSQGQREVLKVDLEAAMNGRDLAGDMPLQPYDVVVVPRSGIADVGRWVDLYIRRVLPVSLGFNYTIDRNGTQR